MALSALGASGGNMRYADMTKLKVTPSPLLSQPPPDPRRNENFILHALAPIVLAREGNPPYETNRRPW